MFTSKNPKYKEARKKAARKQQATSLFTGLFSSRDDDGMDVPVREAGQHRERQSSRGDHREDARSHQHRPAQYDYDTPRGAKVGCRIRERPRELEGGCEIRAAVLHGIL